MSGELHAASLLRMNRVMKCMGIQPVRNHLDAKLLCTLIVMTAVGVSTYLYLSFDYSSMFIFREEPLSIIFDFCDFVFLMAVHTIVVVQRIWLNSRQDVDGQLQRILLKMDEYLGQQVDLQRVRTYCNAVYGSLLIRCLLSSLMTVYINEPIIYYAFFSNLVLLVSFSEFTLYCVVILALYQELILAGSRVLRELDSTGLEPNAVHQLSLEKLEHLQRLHRLLWQAMRSLEGNFHLSLICVLLKLFVDSSSLPYWIYLNQIEHMEVSAYVC